MKFSLKKKWQKDKKNGKIWLIQVVRKIIIKLRLKPQLKMRKRPLNNLINNQLKLRIQQPLNQNKRENIKIKVLKFREIMEMVRLENNSRENIKILIKILLLIENNNKNLSQNSLKRKELN